MFIGRVLKDSDSESPSNNTWFHRWFAKKDKTPIKEEEEEEEESTSNFNVVVNTHGGYNPERIAETRKRVKKQHGVSMVEKYKYYHLIPDTYKYTNAARIRKVVHISPLGCRSRSSVGINALFIELIFWGNVDPIIASQYVYPLSYMQKDLDERKSKCRQKICNQTDNLYELYIPDHNTPSHVKIYRYDMPAQNQYLNTGTAGYIAYLNKNMRGYFLLNRFHVKIGKNIMTKLNTIIDIMNEILIGYRFSKLDEPTFDASTNMYTIQYPKKFNMSQCKYFIAYNMMVIYFKDINVSGERVKSFIENNILKRNIDKNETTGKYVITDEDPFLVNIIDLTSPNVHDGISVRVKTTGEILTKDSDVVNMLARLPSPISEINSAVKPIPIGFNESIPKNFTEENIERALTMNRECFSLSLFEFDEKMMMQFIGRVDSVSEYVINCSNVITESARPGEKTAFLTRMDKKNIARGTRKKK